MLYFIFFLNIIFDVLLPLNTSNIVIFFDGQKPQMFSDQILLRINPNYFGAI